MTTRHHLSHAEELYRGAAYYPPFDRKPGLLIPALSVYELLAPIVGDPDGIAEAQSDTGAHALALDGVLVSGGVATFDYPRCIVVDSGGADTAVLTITGTDIYGQPLVEAITLNGATAVNGKKAFKTVSSVAASATIANGAFVGTTNIFGLPHRLLRASHLLAFNADGSVEDATIAVAVATDPATSTTGDVRGTVVPTTTPNGTINFAALYMVDPSTKVSAFGVAQYGG